MCNFIRQKGKLWKRYIQSKDPKVLFCYKIFVISAEIKLDRQTDLINENSAVRQITYDFLLVRHCKYSSILYRFWAIWRWIKLMEKNLTKFRRNRTIGRWVMAKKAIFKMAVAAILNLKKIIFYHVTAIGFNICCSVLLPFGRGRV